MAGPQAHLHQHDLAPEAAKQVAAAAKLAPGSVVFEPGAGTGRLTAALLAQGAMVHAVEIDRSRAVQLRTQFANAIAADQLSVLTGDAMTLLPELPAKWHVVANPPFKHSAELIRRLLVDDIPIEQPQSLTLLLQAQAVHKWCGGRQGHSRSSVLAHCYGRPQQAGRMPRDAVDPPSHVDLAILRIERSPDAPTRHELARIDRLLERAFAGPHRVRDALRGLATPAICARQGREHGWLPDAHPRTLEPSAWRALAAFLHSIGRLG